MTAAHLLSTIPHYIHNGCRDTHKSVARVRTFPDSFPRSIAFAICSASEEESVKLHVMLQCLYNPKFTLFAFFYPFSLPSSLPSSLMPAQRFCMSISHLSSCSSLSIYLFL